VKAKASQEAKQELVTGEVAFNQAHDKPRGQRDEDNELEQLSGRPEERLRHRASGGDRWASRRGDLTT
jgi:hypothetical protein